MKLDYIKLGPFKIKRKLSPVTFELELPRNSRIHSVFHAVLLETAPAGAPTIAPETLKGEEEYKVSAILDS